MDRPGCASLTRATLATGGKFANGAISGAVQGAMARSSSAQFNEGDGGLEGDPVLARQTEKMVNNAMLKAGVFKPGGYATEDDAAHAWWGSIKGLKLKAEVGVLISEKNGRYYLGSAYSDGAYRSVGGILDNGYVTKGTRLVALAHTHPGSAHLSGGEYAYKLGMYDNDGMFVGYDRVGDMRSAYNAGINVYSFHSSGTFDYFNTSRYIDMQKADPGAAVPLCRAATLGCR